ncbi:MAG: thiolase family protein [Chloroflexi bacterium]|nr:thiolase family protein [Chloroflexota bacterium]
MEDVVLAGVGMHPFGRYREKDPADIALEAITVALKDANMTFKDIQLALCGTVLLNRPQLGAEILQGVGQTGIPIYDIRAACATGGAMLRLARDAISSGSCDAVLVFGIDKHQGMFQDLGEPWQNTLGMKASPSAFAMVAQRYMYEYGATEEDFARVAVKAHKYGRLNPYAMFRQEFTIEQVLKSPYVAWPLHLYNFCSPDDGAAAVVVCSKKIARKHNISQPVYLAASVMATADYPSPILEPSSAYSITTKKKGRPVVVAAGEQAYKEAGIGPGDIEVVEVQDTESAHELVHIEQLGLCRPGEAYHLLREGTFDITGRLPVNPSGGIQCKGEPPGASGLGQVCEIMWQLRGQAGPRQVNHPKVGLSQVFGWNHIGGVTILKK